jgi:hypothetical protein
VRLSYPGNGIFHFSMCHMTARPPAACPKVSLAVFLPAK